jgi:hypothetical protein
MELKNLKNKLSNSLTWLVPLLGALVIIASMILCSCAPTYVLRNRFDDYYTKSQVDSILVKEGLPQDLSVWNKGYMVGDDKNIVTQYMFLPKRDTAVYIITDCDSMYRFKKRVKIKLDK